MQLPNGVRAQQVFDERDRLLYLRLSTTCQTKITGLS